MKTTEQLKSEGLMRQAGQLARMQGNDRYYGCHFGMRSTLGPDKAEFYRGWDEIDSAMQAAETMREPITPAVVEIGDKVMIDSEMYCGTAFIRKWHERGAYVSLDRFSKEFFVLARAIVELR